MADPFYKDLPDHPFCEMPTYLGQSFSQSCGFLPELGDLRLFIDLADLDMDQPLADLVDESTRPPSPDNMKEINLAGPELPNINIDPNTVPDDLFKIEVIDEAPTDLEQPGTLSSCLSSITSTAAPGGLNIDACLQELETIETQDVSLQCAPKPPKRKMPSTFEQAPVAKRASPPLIPQEQQVTRRRKKNEQSRRWRASRKQKDQELFTKEKEELKSNTELKAQIEELTREKEALTTIIQCLRSVRVVN